MRVPCVSRCSAVALAFVLAWTVPDGAAQTVDGTVVEYVNTADFPNSIGGQYFYSSDPAEQAVVDAGGAGQFRRTGFTFNAGGDTDLCRFYGSMSPGPNSHFFTAGAAECASLRAAQITPRPAAVKQWNYEGNGFKVVALVNGACPANSLPVYRAYNNGFTRGFDSNHRYTTSVNSLAPLLDLGWSGEGIVFCSAQVPGVAPALGEALTCGVMGTAGGLGGRNQPLGLQRQLIDLASFPDARCNDGSAGVFYFRPYEGTANRDKWLIHLQGGGSCSSPDDCAQRYCSVDTGFGMQGMSSFPAPTNGINGLGIMARRGEVNFTGPSPFENFNQVFIKYCSSDKWVGTAKDVVVTGAHPLTQAPLTYRVNFLGSRIIDAVLAQLRRTNGQPAVYMLSPAPTAMPDLDAAEQVVLAGGSGGGNGTAQNLDRVAALLKAGNTRCADGTCPEVRGLIDSSFTPPQESLDFSHTDFCLEDGICTAEAAQRAQETSGSGKLWKPQWDQSCLDYHSPANATWRCLDSTFVARNHITTPFFVRMGLIDENIGPQLVEGKFALPGKGPMTMADFALTVKANLAALADIKTLALEKVAITTVPGAFGPLCPEHETLRGPETFDAAIESGGQVHRMFTLFLNWINGTGLINLSSSNSTDTQC